MSNTYGDGPHLGIEAWHQEACNDCGDRRHDDDMTYCYACDEKYCYDAILKPKNSKEVKAIVEYAKKNKITIIPSGGGYSHSGQLFPIDGGFLLNLSKLNKILEVNISDRYAIVECGVRLKELNEVLGKDRFYFPPAHDNIEDATIGGIIGNNASSLFRNYPVDHTLGLEVMLSTGEIVKMGSKTLKNVSGYNTSSLFFGSEGRLGIILKAIIKIDPKRDEQLECGFKERFHEIMEKKPLFIGIKSNLKNLETYEKKFNDLRITKNLELEYHVSNLGNFSYIITILYLNGSNDLKIVKEAYDAIKNQIFDNKDGLIPDFGIGLWNLELTDLKHEELFLYEKIKKSFDPNNLLNPKNYHSAEVQKIQQLLK